MAQNNITEKCSNRIIEKYLKINIVEVNSCMKTQLSSNKTIPILEQDREVIKSLGGILRPSILINNFTYRGDLEVDDIFKAMCSGF